MTLSIFLQLFDSPMLLQYSMPTVANTTVEPEFSLAA